MPHLPQVWSKVWSRLGANTFSSLGPLGQMQRRLLAQLSVFNRSERLQMLAPLLAVGMFLLLLAFSFVYLRLEESAQMRERIEQDQLLLQQRVGLRLREQATQMASLGLSILTQGLDASATEKVTNALILELPELHSISWMSSDGLTMKHLFAMQYADGMVLTRELLKTQPTSPITQSALRTAQLYRMPVLSDILLRTKDRNTATLQHVYPVQRAGKVMGFVVLEFAVHNLVYWSLSPDLRSRYAISVWYRNRLDQEHFIGGEGENERSKSRRPLGLQWLEGLTGLTSADAQNWQVPSLDSHLMVRAVPYQYSGSYVGSALFWLTVLLSLLTTWLLIASWRNGRRRAQVQKDLQAETLFRRAMEDSMRIGIRVLNLQGKTTYVNPAFCQLVGWPAQQLLGLMPPFPYWPVDEVDVLQRLFSRELAHEEPVNAGPVQLKRRNGELFYARIHTAPLIDVRGQRSGWISSFADITESTRVRQQLSEAHDHFTTVLESLESSVSVTPLGSTTLLFANRRYREWFDGNSAGHIRLVSEAGMQGHVLQSSAAENDRSDAVDSMAGLPLKDVTSSESAWQNLSQSPEVEVPELGLWLEVRARYISWVDGRLAQMLIATDISARRQAEESAAHQAVHMEAVSRLVTMGEMASGVAHELNQPLTAINNYCSGMLARLNKQGLSETELRTALEKTGRQAERAGAIVQRIRAMARRSEPRRVPTQAGDLVRDALEFIEPDLRRRNVRVRPQLALHLPTLQVDPVLVVQVLVNLMKNAAEAIDLAQRPAAQRRIELKVHLSSMKSSLSADAGQRVVEFHIKDQGKGLSEGALAHMYETFFTTKTDGMGIGLNLCRSVIESHQGCLLAENYSNSEGLTLGCIFRVCLPV